MIEQLKESQLKKSEIKYFESPSTVRVYQSQKGVIILETFLSVELKNVEFIKCLHRVLKVTHPLECN